MRGQTTITERLAAALVLLIAAALLSIQLAPSMMPMGRDNGIFSYTAQVMLDGGVLYRDVWENKLPGVYVIDALAFAAFGTTRWAVWGMEVAFVAAAAWVMFALLRARYPARGWLAWGGSLTFTLMARNPDVLWDVNFTETYALLPQVLVFYLGWRVLQGSGVWTAFGMGLAASTAFILKQTTIGVALAFVPALVLTRHAVLRRRPRGGWLAVIILGGLAGLGVTAAGMAAYGVLDDGLDATFVGTRALHAWISGDAPVGFWGSIRETLESSVLPGWIAPVLPLVLIGAGAALRRAWAGRVGRTGPLAAAPGPDAHPDAVTLGVWALLTALADPVLVNATGRGYEHYYATVIPAVVLLIAGGWAALARWAAARPRIPRRVTGAVVLYVLVVSAIVPAVNTIERLRDADWDVFGPAQMHESSEWVLAHTQPGDPLLVWGAASDNNFVTGRRSPTAYHYAYPLIVPDYTTTAMITQLLDDLTRHLPLVIMDRGLVDGRRVPPLGDADRARWLREMDGRADTFDLSRVFVWVDAHCDERDRVDDVVYYTCTAQQG